MRGSVAAAGQRDTHEVTDPTRPDLGGSEGAEGVTLREFIVRALQEAGVQAEWTRDDELRRRCRANGWAAPSSVVVAERMGGRAELRRIARLLFAVPLMFRRMSRARPSHSRDGL